MALEAERTQLRLNAMGGAVSYEDNNTSSKTNGTERKLMRLADEETDIDKQIEELRLLQREIRERIASLHNNDLESVLIYRYISPTKPPHSLPHQKPHEYPQRLWVQMVFQLQLISS